MIIYSSPGTGKSTFCKKHKDWTDGDVILFSMINRAFNINLSDTPDKGKKILLLFKTQKITIERTYTEYMVWLRDHRQSHNILIGSKRAMRFASKIYLKETRSDIFVDEIEFVKQRHLKYTILNKDQYISDVILNYQL